MHMVDRVSCPIVGFHVCHLESDWQGFDTDLLGKGGGLNFVEYTGKAYLLPLLDLLQTVFHLHNLLLYILVGQPYYPAQPLPTPPVRGCWGWLLMAPELGRRCVLL